MGTPLYRTHRRGDRHHPRTQQPQPLPQPVVETAPSRQANPRHRPELQTVASSRSILITGGIGDFIAVDSLMPSQVRLGVTSIWFATRAAREICELINAYRMYPNCSSFHEVDRSKWKADVVHTMADLSVPLPGVDDYSIAVQFVGEKMQCQPRVFDIVGGVSRWQRPVVIHPGTAADDRFADRCLTEQEWEAVVRWLVEKGLEAVVIGADVADVPVHPALLNLIGKTSVVESLELVKGGSYFLGVDSWPSVVFSKKWWLPMSVKSVHPEHLLRHFSWYYYPRTDPGFVSSTLVLP